jgi:hypothetical protein
MSEVFDRGIATDWMRELGAHYARMRDAYPDDELCIVFDIDGTILDTRYLVVHLLHAYDREHDSEFFARLRPEGVTVHETQIEALLESLALPEGVRRHVSDWYQQRLWHLDPGEVAHRPYRGVLDVVRWFQLQPKTSVAVNTGRPERVREQTLVVMNAVAAGHRVLFDPELLCMNPYGWEEGVTDSKVAALSHLRAAGLRVFAVVDNEPENIRAMADADEHGEILFLHADTIFTSQRVPMPRTVSGSDYELAGLVPEQELRRRVQFVWHGVNDEDNLRQFLASDVHWAECDVRRDPLHRLVTRHDGFEEVPLDAQEEPLLLERALHRLKERNRAIKLDLKEGEGTLDAVLSVISELGFADDQLWFNASLGDLGGEAIAMLRRLFPRAVISCPANFLAPLAASMPENAAQVCARLREFGVTRLSLRWSLPGLRGLLEALEGMGWEVNIYEIPDLAAFLEAALLLPRSVTADFNFPAWSYFGRGSGESLGKHRYALVAEG